MLKALTLDEVEKVISLARKLTEKHSEKSPLGTEWPNEDVEKLIAYMRDRRPLVEFIDNLSAEARAELVAIMWIGRGPETKSDFDKAVIHAKTLRDDLSDYIATKAPALPSYLTKGREKLESGSN